MNSKYILQNATIISPADGINSIGSILIKGKKILGIEMNKLDSTDGYEVIDCTGLHIFPGFIDLHTHLREPGREDKETIETGSRAAAAGGYTTICAMPNTNPVMDNQSGVNFLKSMAKEKAIIEVLPIAAVTQGQKGKNIVEFGDLVEHGVVGFSDDGQPISSPRIMQLAMTYCQMFHTPIMVHAEEKSLTQGGVMNYGKMALKLGLKGMQAIAEAVMISRDLFLHKYIPCPLHFCHVSSKESVKLIREALQTSDKVSAEVTPHHLTLTDEMLDTFNTNLKMSPPVRREKDRYALIEGLKDNTIKSIATDHAPHTKMEKEMVFTDAPFGIIGLETAFNVLYTDLVRKDLINLDLLIEKLTTGPASIISYKGGRIKKNQPADLCIWDLSEQHMISSKFESKGQNSPYIGKEVYGKLKYTIKNGSIVWKNV